MPKESTDSTKDFDILMSNELGIVRLVQFGYVPLGVLRSITMFGYAHRGYTTQGSQPDWLAGRSLHASTKQERDADAQRTNLHVNERIEPCPDPTRLAVDLTTLHPRS